MCRTENEPTDWKETYGCSIENYIREDNHTDYSICREERQYVVFLYNILRKYRKPEDRKKNDIIQAMFQSCSIPDKADVTYIFYEATFMRDFFERNRRIHWKASKSEKLLQKSYSPKEKRLRGDNSFNYWLLKYAYEDKYGKDTFPIPCDEWNLEERNLGHCTKKDFEMFKGEGEKVKNLLPYVQQMMNAKPDIAVVYRMHGVSEEDNKDYLLFLECKFESYESSYSFQTAESNGTPCFTQCELQYKIADFLCKNYLKMEVSPFMKNDDNNKDASRIIQFVRQKSKQPKLNEILISDLIELNNQIFA